MSLRAAGAGLGRRDYRVRLSTMCGSGFSSSSRPYVRVGLAVVMVWLLAGRSPLAGQPPGGADHAAVVFCAMGDVPYSPDEARLLPQQIADLPGDAEFLVHLGDIKRGGPPCLESVYQNVAGMLRRSRVPTFIVPGDNEWNDCADPDEAWRHWQRHLLRLDQHWPHRLPVFRQLARAENYSFVHGGVLFVGLNLVGGRVHDRDEWQRRHAENVAWLTDNLAQFGGRVRAVVLFAHARPRPDHHDFFAALSAQATQLAKPVLYLHGDGHRWNQDRPFTAQNILRVQVDQGGIAPPVKVTVTLDEGEAFRFDRRQ